MQQSTQTAIGFLGVGNMGGAILRGYSAALAERTGEGKQGTSPIIYAYRRDLAKLEVIAEETGAIPCDSVEELVQKSDVIFIGVKPVTFPDIMPVVARRFTADKVCVSMAAGITIATLEEYLGPESKVVRIMPNTPAMVGEGMTAISGNGNVTPQDLRTIREVLFAVGAVEEVPEDLIHAVTAVAGSSPAYTYMYIDALIRQATNHGMAAEKARLFAAQAVLGAAKMVLESGETPEQLRINVCSPGGVTIRAVEALQEGGFEDIVARAFDAAVARSKEMSESK